MNPIYRLSRINIPATMPSTAKPVVTVAETLMLSNGKRPVRINQSPSKIIPRFLPAKLLVSAISSPYFLKCKSSQSAEAQTPIGLGRRDPDAPHEISEAGV